MSKNIWKAVMFSVLVSLLISGCDSGQQTSVPVVQPPAPQPMPPVPQPVAVAPVAPPPTPLVPIAEAVEEQSANKGGRQAKRKSGGDSIDKPLPGNKTGGDELVGNYSCKLNSKDLPLGPFKLPGFGCRIFRANNGDLRIGPSSPGIAAIRGKIDNPTDTGFFIAGGYQFPGNKLSIKVRMKRKAGAKPEYAGKGRGMLNKDKSTKKEYTFEMKKK